MLVENSKYTVNIPRCASFPEGATKEGVFLGKIRVANGFRFLFDFDGVQIGIPNKAFII